MTTTGRLTAWFAVACLTLGYGTLARAGEWKRLPSLPDEHGVAGAFAGMSGGALIVAGGANFPDKKPWEGGNKVWHDTVYVLERPDGEWRVAGKLPRPVGYGVSVTHGAGVVCVGGSDAKRHYANAFRLAWNAGKLTMTELPSLPTPLANACGALVGDTLYVAGGQELPDSRAALKAVWSIELTASSPAWRRLPDLPGPGRILAVAASAGESFFVAGGAELREGENGVPMRAYLRDAWRYRPQEGWEQVADTPFPSAAPPSPAPADDRGFYVLGGDDGSQVGVAPEAHEGFRKNILRYDLADDRWTNVGESPAARVTVPCVFGFGAWIVPSGEARPGIRSPEVWSFSPEDRR